MELQLQQRQPEHEQQEQQQLRVGCSLRRMIALDLSLENIYRQYHHCRRNKRNTVNALRFEAEQEKNLIALREALIDRSYQPRRSVCFFTTRPKLREILAADFRDRVVHHLLVDYLEKIWEPIFIHDSYACRKGKGVHKGVTRLQQFIRQVTANGTQPAWYLQLDIRNYFMSIDRDILFGMLAAKLSDETALWLTRMLVYHDVTENCHFRGRADLLKKIPPHKTLFGAGPDKGLPIGNLNSQFFANVYLNRLDQFVKHDLKCYHYLRYCDDFVLLSHDQQQLVDWRDQIKGFLRDELRLVLNDRQRLAPVSNGIDFLGYIVRRDYRLVRRRVVGHLKAKLKVFEAQLVSIAQGVCCYRFDEVVLDRLAAVLSSYLGHFKLASTWNLWRSIWRQFEFLSRYFAFDAQRRILIRLYPAPMAFRC
ncbi:MAG: reverse transcriptase/maturase family protein [Pseudomonadota bacterium]